MTNFDYDTLIFDHADIREEVHILFDLESNCTQLATVDINAVLSIVLTTMDDLRDKPLEDIQHLVENFILETTDLKNYSDYLVTESDAANELQLIGKAIAIVVQLVLRTIENLGLSHGHFPYRFQRTLPNHALVFKKEEHGQHFQQAHTG